MTQHPAPDTQHPTPNTQHLNWLGRLALAVSGAAVIPLSVCYLLQPDRTAGLTVFPAWLWFILGIQLATLGWRSAGKTALAVVIALWVGYLLAFAEEPWSLARVRPWPSRAWSDARSRGRALRVVSLNCAGGSIEAASEVMSASPDIVLLQETPGREEVRRLAFRLFGDAGGYAWSPETSILARGRVESITSSSRAEAFFIEARVRLPSDTIFDVVSLRLEPPVVRLDVWSAGYWQAQARIRSVHRDQLREVARRVEALPSSLPVITGGDFNMPAGDAAAHPLRPELRDAFEEGGVGWGDTAMNEIPTHRIDQIWIGDPLRAAAVWSRRTRHSDHRMVVCDLFVR